MRGDQVAIQIDDHRVIGVASLIRRALPRGRPRRGTCGVALAESMAAKAFGVSAADVVLNHDIVVADATAPNTPIRRVAGQHRPGSPRLVSSSAATRLSMRWTFRGKSSVVRTYHRSRRVAPSTPAPRALHRRADSGGESGRPS